MAIESHLALGNEPEAVEPRKKRRPSKEFRRNRKERRERHRLHVPLPETHTVWTRSDPNRLQPLGVKQARPVPRPEKVKVFAAQPKATEAPPARPQLEPLADVLKQQELPQLPADMRRRFRQESDVRIPNEAHDALPSARRPESAVETATANPGTRTPEQTAAEPVKHETPAEATETATITEHEPVPERSPAPVPAETPAPPEQPETPTERPTAGEQLRQIADQKARRAAEIAEKHRDSTDKKSPEILPLSSEADSNPVEQAVADGRMGRTELLALAGSIRIDGVSVAEMFRAGRLDEEGLRHVVTEFLRGHDVHKLITDEVLRLALKFERDPQLRAARVSVDSDAARRTTASAKSRAKKALNPRAARHHVIRLADRLADEFDRALEAAEDHPAGAKTMVTVLAVVAYLVILVLIIKS